MLLKESYNFLGGLFNYNCMSVSRIIDYHDFDCTKTKLIDHTLHSAVCLDMLFSQSSDSCFMSNKLKTEVDISNYSCNFNMYNMLCALYVFNVYALLNDNY